MVEALRDVPPNAPRWSEPFSVVLLVRNRPSEAQPELREIEVREEATSAEHFRRFGGGSTVAKALVNCRTREFMLQSFTFYSRNNLTGDVLTSSNGRPDWRPAPSGSVLDRAITMTCGGAPARLPTSREAGLRPAVRAAAAAPASGAPRAVPARSSRAQIGAAPSGEAAREALAALARKHPGLFEGLATSVESASVNGRRVFRALVAGFRDRGAAAGFCAALKARGDACFVRD